MNTTTKTTQSPDLLGPVKPASARGAPSLQSSVETVMRGVEEARKAAAVAITRMDEEIRDLSDAQAKLLAHSVREADVVALVSRNIRALVANERSVLLSRVGAATSLGAHVAIKRGGVMIADGSFVFEEKDASGVDLFYSLSTSAGLAALLLDDASIDALASRWVKAVGAKQEGESVEDLASKARDLADRIESLCSQRAQLQRELKDFIDVKLSPFVGAIDKPTQTDSPPTPSTPPTVVRSGLVRVTQTGAWR